jgi:acetylornithine deacetylase/succinyl-diaminopimelate desuccinylase-like protein
MASPALSFARNNQQRFLNELKDLLRIPSVSTLDEHKDDVRKAAEFVAAELRRKAMENVELISTKGHPLLYADWLHAPGKPTVLMYAHFDVQPPDRWMSGFRRRSSRQSAIPTSMRAARSTTKANCGWK